MRHRTGCLANSPANPPPRPREAPRRSKGAGISPEIETLAEVSEKMADYHVARERGSRLRLKHVMAGCRNSNNMGSKGAGISPEIETYRCHSQSRPSEQ